MRAFEHQIETVQNILISLITPPLIQFKSGFTDDIIQCRENLVLVVKAINDYPACVKPETKKELIERVGLNLYPSFIEKLFKIKN